MCPLGQTLLYVLGKTVCACVAGAEGYKVHVSVELHDIGWQVTLALYESQL